jgi:endonuclease YncB( thermonuclease family)
MSPSKRLSPPPPEPAYVFRAEFISNHDGDTVTLRLDHGKFPDSKACTEAVLRVKGLFCPELSQKGGPEARDAAHDLLSTATRIVAATYKGTFARTVADIWIDGMSFAELMIAAGHGSPHG